MNRGKNKMVLSAQMLQFSPTIVVQPSEISAVNLRMGVHPRDVNNVRLICVQDGRLISRLDGADSSE